MTEPAERIGSLIDERYKVTEVMASGAMGAVYKAERVPVGKLVAIKFLHSSYANDPEFQARFERETRVMSKLNHPNCVSVLDFGVWDGAPYLVMDFVDGKTLRTRLDEGPVTVTQALGIARQVLAGLAHAHAQEVFHRDVKPANIMISEEIGHGDRVRILDFGLARLQGNVGRDATQINMVVGTPNYMAPEQTVPGTTIDARTDLYAVGILLFEMVVGERPFNSEDTLQLLGMQRAAPVPRLTDRLKSGTEIPAGLQEIIDKAMAKSPDARFQSAIEFADAIDRLTGAVEDKLPKLRTGPVVSAGSSMELGSTVLSIGKTDVGRRLPPRKSRTGSWLGLLLLVGGASAMAAYLIKRSADNKNVTAKVVEVRQDAGARDQGQGPAMRPDGGPTGMMAGSVPATGDASVQIEAPSDAGTAVAVAPTGPVDEFGLPIIYGDGGVAEVDEAEIEIDPTVAEDPDDLNKGSAAPPEDETEDAPKTVAEIEKREAPPPAPQLARTVHAAVVMIKQGKKPLALASLRALWKKQPRSAYIPFLLGNLYFDKQWWSVSMDHYRAAIKKNQGYRANAVLNRNVIRMLASTKTRQKATNFLRGVIGRYSKPHLRAAARNEKNPVVRKQAATLARYIR